MTTILKQQIHSLIDSCTNEALLNQVKEELFVDAIASDENYQKLFAELENKIDDEAEHFNTQVKIMGKIWSDENRKRQ